MWKVRKRDSRATDRKATAIFDLDTPTTKMQSDDASPSAGLMAERDIHLRQTSRNVVISSDLFKVYRLVPFFLFSPHLHTIKKIFAQFSKGNHVIPSFFPLSLHATMPLVTDGVSNLFFPRRGEAGMIKPRRDRRLLQCTVQGGCARTLIQLADHYNFKFKSDLSEFISR